MVAHLGLLFVCFAIFLMLGDGYLSIYFFTSDKQLFQNLYAGFCTSGQIIRFVAYQLLAANGNLIAIMNERLERRTLTVDARSERKSSLFINSKQCFAHNLSAIDKYPKPSVFSTFQSIFIIALNGTKNKLNATRVKYFLSQKYDAIPPYHSYRRPSTTYTINRCYG